MHSSLDLSTEGLAKTKSILAAGNIRNLHSVDVGSFRAGIAQDTHDEPK